MGLADRIERKLESTVGDAFARVFGGSIVPQEVEAMLHREAGAGVRELAGGRILAPNDYIITLSVPDYQKVSADPDLTSTTFAKHLEGYIHEQGWQTYGDVVVRFEQSANLHTGQFRARGAVNPDSTTAEAAPALRDRAFTAEPGVPPMTDNPSNRGGQGQGRPDEYDDRYGRPEDREGGQEPSGQYPPPDQRADQRDDQRDDQPGYPPQGDPGYGQRQGYPDQGGGYPDRGGGYPDRVAATPTGVATRRRPTNSVRPPAIHRRAAATPTRATVRHPAVTRRPAASRGTAATTAVSPPRRRGRRTTAVRNPGPPTLTRAAIRRTRAAATPTRATAASPTGARTRVMERSPTTAATASPRQAAVTPSPDTRSRRAAATTTVLRPAAATAPATGRVTIRPAAPPSPCSSTTAAAGPISCARAPM